MSLNSECSSSVITWRAQPETAITDFWTVKGQVQVLLFGCFKSIFSATECPISKIQKVLYSSQWDPKHEPSWKLIIAI